MKVEVDTHVAGALEFANGAVIGFVKSWDVWAEAHYRLGFCAVQTGDLERAGRAWDTYIRLTPNGDQRQKVASALAAVKTLTQILDRTTAARP